MLLAKAIGLQTQLAYETAQFLLGMLVAAILEIHAWRIASARIFA